MLRISEKLIDFYRRRTEGKRTWIRFVAIVLAMGSIVAFFLYHTLTVRDRRKPPSRNRLRLSKHSWSNTITMLRATRRKALSA